MQKTIPVLVFSLMFGSAPLIFSSSADLRGRTLDQKGVPIPGVKIEVVDTNAVTESLSDGLFVLENISEEKVLLLFTHPEYLPLSLEVFPEKKAQEVLDVFLTPKNPILMTIKEEVTVTAKADSIIDINLPSHRTILPSSVLNELGTSNIAETVEKVPGVTMVGKGGYSMSPAIRGLAENRILLLVDGVRITSERRIGASASFINLNNIDHIEINRGPYSVFHGSGAVGGIINIVTQSPAPGDPLKGKFSLSYNTAKEERAGSAQMTGSLGKYGFLFGINGKKADDYMSPSGIIEESQYSDYDLMMKINREGKNSRFYTTFFHYQGKDIGKPSPTSRLKPRWYPDETNTLLTLGYGVDNALFMDSINASAYVMQSSLETQGDNLNDDLSLKKRNLALIEGTNYGFKIRGNKKLAESHTFSIGLDYFGRGGINDSNTEWLFDQNLNITAQTDETSLQKARQSNFGLYIDDKIDVSNVFSLNLGMRADLLATSNLDPSGQRISRKDESFTAYLGSEFHVGPKLSLLANLGRSFRFPTTSELFYSGLTGRGTVFGNPDLEPEKSWNLDFGVRYLHERFFASIYGFSNLVSDMIQKYEGEVDEEFYYRNLIQGRVSGFEGEFYVLLMKNVELFVNGHLITGKEKDSSTSLNYIPPSRLTFWTKFSPGDFWIEPKLILASPVKNPGPLEMAIDGYTLFDAIIGYRINSHFNLLAVLQNLTDETYRLSADEAGVDAPGRSFVFRVDFTF
jgi:outer membrane receptor protein involved in Fe transport